MHEHDRENWKAIDSGARQATWADFVGDVEGVAYLSSTGAKLVPRIVDDLTTCFGRNWLSTALRPGPAGRMPWLGKFSPVLTLVSGERGAAGAFIELVRWWAALESQATRPGMGQVRKDLRNDITITRLLHTLTQTRLGAIATTARLAVRYEPNPGDLQISDGQNSVTVEVFAMRTARDIDAKLKTSEEMFEHLDQLSRLHGVHFYGSLPAVDSDLSDWRQRMSNDAATASRLRLALSVIWNETQLFVEPGHAPEGTALDGPMIEGDIGTRLRTRVRSKAHQIAKAEAGWLWLENHGAVDMLVPIHSNPLSDQLAAYETLYNGALNEVDSAMCITFSSAGSRAWPPPVEELSLRHARALRQPLPLDRVRTSFHLPKTEGPGSCLMWRVSSMRKNGLTMRSMRSGSAAPHWTSFAPTSDDLRKRGYPSESKRAGVIRGITDGTCVLPRVKVLFVVRLPICA